MIKKIIGSLVLLPIAVGSLVIMAFGKAMSGFNSRSSEAEGTIIMCLTLVVFLTPIISIWIRSKITLVIGGCALLPALMAGLLLLMMPVIGIPFLIAVLIWYKCAHLLWKEMSNHVIDPTRYARGS